MADIKRIVNTKFWIDEKVIDNYSVEDKYFMLYLLTNPRTSQLGIYKLPKKVASFETGYTREVIEVLLQRFQDKYNNILYNHETQEITVLNSLRYSIVKGGAPVTSLLTKELTQVESDMLIKETYDHMVSWWNKSSRETDGVIKSLFEEELSKRKVPKEKNDNDNDNDNEVSGYDSGYDSQPKIKEDDKKAYGELENVMLTDDQYDKLKEKFPKDYTDKIDNLSFYISSKGKKYKNHYATILSWSRKEAKETVKAKNNKIDKLWGV